MDCYVYRQALETDLTQKESKGPNCITQRHAQMSSTCCV